MKDYYKDFDGMDMPWVESPFFYDLLESVKLTEEQYNLAKHFHEEGYVILDLELVIFLIMTLIISMIVRYVDMLYRSKYVRVVKKRWQIINRLLLNILIE